ncbi:hypothetical protein VTN31DRAFT_5600 [Thermomyces dupontii]|uniref:uncharacterized protein n=1 Tax=Talaromyces thermophilus TaxID=28565 RepID=UPI00374345A2
MDLQLPGRYPSDEVEVKIYISIFTAVAWYNAIELVVLIFVTFRSYRGLYFWSLLVSSTLGVCLHALGFMLKYFDLSAKWFFLVVLTIGWYCMVTGQSIVLYSRLHLIVRNPKVLQRVLYMIIIDALILHLPTTALTFASNFHPDNRTVEKAYDVMEKLQMTGFCLQEFILSGVYIAEAMSLLRISREPGSRKVMYQLLSINLIIILMDIALLVVEYLNYYVIETTLKSTIYSIKLKLEFAVLSKLVHIARHGWQADAILGTKSQSPNEFPDFVDATRVTSDVTHAAPPEPKRPFHRQHRRDSLEFDDISISTTEHAELDTWHEPHSPRQTGTQSTVHGSRLSTTLRCRHCKRPLETELSTGSTSTGVT